jgi:hypothetical protein
MNDRPIAENAVEPPATSTIRKKWADHPHGWTIALSLVAIVVSTFSYLESHRSRILNEEVNRPLVRVTGITTIGAVLGNFESDGPRQTNSYSLAIRNSGKSFAKDVKVELKAQLEDARTGTGFAKFSDVEDATQMSETIGDLAPDDDYQLTLWAQVLKKNPTIPFGDHEVNMVSLYIKGVASYTNPINQVRYSEAFCFLEAGSNGTFHRCSSNASLTK